MATACWRGSVEQVKVLSACPHGVDDELIAAVEAEDDNLEKAAGRVETKAQLPRWTVVVQVAYEHGLLCCQDCVSWRDTVLAR